MDGCGEQPLFLEAAGALFLESGNYGYLSLFYFSEFVLRVEIFENLD